MTVSSFLDPLEEMERERKVNRTKRASNGFLDKSRVEMITRVFLRFVLKPFAGKKHLLTGLGQISAGVEISRDFLISSFCQVIFCAPAPSFRIGPENWKQAYNRHKMIHKRLGVGREGYSVITYCNPVELPTPLYE